MDVPELMTAMAARIRQVPKIGPVHYPKPNRLDASPCVVITEGGPTAGPTLIDRSSTDGQHWTARVTVSVLVTYQDETPREESRIDTLITPIVDAFDPVAWDGNINDALSMLSGQVDAIDPVSVTRGATTYAGQPCYIAAIVFEARFSRYPDLIPL